MSWTDSRGNLWLFGGNDTEDNGNGGYFNDLWEFNPSTNEWTWMGGSSTLSQPGVYGTLGVPAAGNIPGSRNNAMSWTDNSGNLWLFGGNGTDVNGNGGYLNDLWEFNPSTNEWTWMGGSSTANQPGVYGTLGTLAAGNIPGGRYSATSWVDGSGNLWLFGGNGTDVNGNGGYLNDLWEFNPSTNEWAWMGGSSTGHQPGVYGTLGVPDAGNIPGGRSYATSWADSSGSFWLFGGLGFDEGLNFDFLNDLWKYQQPVTAIPTFSVPAGTYATMQTVTISDATDGATIYYTTNGTTPTTASSVYSGAITVSSTETLEAVATASGYSTSAMATAAYTINPAWATTTTTLESRPVASTVIYGEYYVTLTATVSASSGTVPDGETVTFMNGTMQLGTGILSSGTASVNINATLPCGIYSITAIYSGDSNFSRSTSAALSLTVTQASTSTTLTSSQNPSDAGQYVTFTAIVTAQFLFRPTGTVLFSNGGTTLGTVSASVYTNMYGTSVSEAVAVFTTTVLPVGTDSISATYSGDANFVGSTSNSVSQVVTPAASGALGWIWMDGSSYVYEGTAVYGTLGVPAAGNIPGSRDSATSWTDRSGNLWLFGGHDNSGELNDLWEFNPSTNEWAWMGGSSTGNQAGVHGTLGVPAAGNIPGGRDGAASWTDNSGNFWLFGGQGEDAYGNYGALNDLWEFNPSTNEWAWMGGSSTMIFENGANEYGQPGVYGTLGMPTAGNIPAGREGASTWTDSSGNLWLFGGWGFDAYGNRGDFNDLWEFDPSTNEWTWMGGSSTMGSSSTFPNSAGQPGVYGTLGVPAAGNIPGGRSGGATWTDSNGNLWLFGGLGFDANGTGGLLNDLWEFNSSTNEWAWMGGSSTVFNTWTVHGQPGVYGTLGVPAAGNIPGVRGGAASWTDSSGNLWLFGGNGIDANGNGGDLNDLWAFNPSTNEWTWMGGSSTVPNGGGQPGVYGTLGMSTVGNTPGGRSSAMSWTDNGGNLWLFGGFGYDVYGSNVDLNDLWKYQPLATAIPTLSVPAGTYTTIQSVTISDATAGATIYYTTDGTTPTTNSTVYGGPITVSSTETLKAIATATGCTTSAVATGAYTINLLPAATPTFSVPASTYTTPQTVTISDATAGAAIYYTTDGTTPTIASAVYSGPITVSNTETIEVIATASGYSQSSVATAAYTINNPVPVTSSLSPAFLSAGGAAFTLTVTGTGFISGSTIYWGATALTTTYVNATQLTASVTAAEIASAGITAITVQTPTPGGGTSNALQFEVDTSGSGSTAPAITAVTATVTAGSKAIYTITLPVSVTSVSVTCLNLPAGATCSYASGTLTITTTSTTPKGTYQITVVLVETVSDASTSWILLPILLLPLMIMRKRLAARGVWVTACLGLVLLAGAALCTGCGGGRGNSDGGGGGGGGGTQTHQVTSSGVVTLTVQ
jgi:N-acetylneuraminic acid mutarotase